MNLVHDELDVAWKNPLNWETAEDEDDCDLREGRERLRMRGRLVSPDAIAEEVDVLVLVSAAFDWTLHYPPLRVTVISDKVRPPHGYFRTICLHNERIKTSMGIIESVQTATTKVPQKVCIQRPAVFACP